MRKMPNCSPALCDGFDPWIVKYGRYYLLVQAVSNGNGIVITKLHRLDTVQGAEIHRVWTPTSGDHSEAIWAPELHHFPELSEKWYIYYSACDGKNENHRMYVLESDTSNPLGSYHELGKIFDAANDRWAIDLTVLNHAGKLYAIWSGWEINKGDFPQNLYIAPMSDPAHICGERVLISRPEYYWEKSVAAINEGPQVLKKSGRLFIIYSADASWTAAYKLGMLIFTGNDLLDPKSWEKHPRPVFEKGKTSINGPGHASFILSEAEENGNDLIVYHRKRDINPGWDDREIVIQKFIWDNNNYPVFGVPH